jgi:peptidoglycan hydrolase CwlO-like protein
MVQNLKTELSSVKMDVIRKDNVIESQAEQLKEKDNIIENLNRRLAHLESRIAETENEGIPLNSPKTQLIFSGDK